MALDRAFDTGTLPSLREAVLAEATAAGMPSDRAADVMLTVHEFAANAVRHGAGAGRLAMRVSDGQLYGQVSDVGSAGGTRCSDGCNAAVAGGAWSRPVDRPHGR